jgi:hypothetical protein
LVFYIVPFTYFYRIRNTLALKARSPKLILIGFVLLGCDSISNTIIFTNVDTNSTSICDLSIACTVIFFFGVLAVYYLRMHRVEQVYLCYRAYLKQQLSAMERQRPRSLRRKQVDETRESMIS